MQPSHHRTILVLIPMSLYIAILGWKFGLGLVGFIVFNSIMQKLALKIAPDAVKKGEP